MSRIYVPTAGPDTWRQYLADPEKHWRTGYSARTLAHAWESADGLPSEMAELFRSHPNFSGEPPELLAAFPEWKVPLPGGHRESQSDVFAVIRAAGRVVAMAVEGKVNKSFGPTLGDWLQDASDGKRIRLAAIQELLGVTGDLPPTLRYQLLHRSASAVLEARRWGTAAAAMIVHSFSPDRMWFEDYVNFCEVLGIGQATGELAPVKSGSNVPLYLGWACGDERFLAA